MEGRSGLRSQTELGTVCFFSLGPAHAGVRGKGVRAEERAHCCRSLKLVLNRGTAGIVGRCRCVDAVLPKPELGIEGRIAGRAGMHAERRRRC